MSTKHHNLSQLDAPLPSAADMKFGIVVAEWNREITEALLEGAVQTLRSAGCSDLNIQIKYVPGTFELTLGTQFFAEYTDVDAVIALGCVVQGETRHFDFICQGVTQGITQLQIQWNMPVAFGILTVNDQQQAFDRAGGKYGNKGNEAAAAAIQMVKLQTDMEAASPNTVPDRKNINKANFSCIKVFFRFSRTCKEVRLNFYMRIHLPIRQRQIFRSGPFSEKKRQRKKSAPIGSASPSTR